MTDLKLKQYIGDSVYCEYRNGGFVLTTENGLPTDPSNTIVLEWEVIHSLERYKQYILDLHEEYKND